MEAGKTSGSKMGVGLLEDTSTIARRSDVSRMGRIGFPYRILSLAVILSVIELYISRPINLTILGTSVVSGLALAVVLAIIVKHLPYGFLPRLGIVSISLFIIQFVNNIIEGAFFSTLSSQQIAGGLIVGLTLSLARSSLAIAFFPTKEKVSFKRSLTGYFAGRSTLSWIWRIGVASLLFLPIFWTFGLLILPIVGPSYADPSMGIRIPPLEVIISIEALRGFLFVVALLPIIVGLRISRRGKFAGVTALLYIPGGFLTMIAPNEILTPLLRAAHGTEILGDFVVFAAVLVYIFGASLPIEKNKKVSLTAKS